jgi:hypothetical protein
LYPSGNPAVLAERIDALLRNQERLDWARGAALAAAQRVFCWERQRPILIRAVERALERAAVANQSVSAPSAIRHTVSADLAKTWT